jgi:hypothetical protein
MSAEHGRYTDFNIYWRRVLGNLHQLFLADSNYYQWSKCSYCLDSLSTIYSEKPSIAIGLQSIEGLSSTVTTLSKPIFEEIFF